MSNKVNEEIRILYKDGVSQKEIAQKINRHITTVSNVVRGKQGRSAKGPIFKPWEGVLGERNHWAKLTEREVLEIREVHRNGQVTSAALAKKHNVSETTVSFIINRKRWKHV